MLGKVEIMMNRENLNKIESTHMSRITCFTFNKHCR